MTRSANIDFFAAEVDQRAVLDFLFSSTDVRVFESYSEYDSELREFRSTEEVAEVFPLGSDPHGNGSFVHLQLWSPSVMRNLTIERFDLIPRYCEGHTFLHQVDGAALMQLYFGGVHGTVVTKSHFGHWSRVRAEADGPIEGVDWEAMKKLSSRIQYHIKERLAVGKAHGYIALRQACELARGGYQLKHSVRAPWTCELEVAEPDQ